MNGKFLHVFLFLVFVFSARFGIGIVSNTALPQALPGIQVSGGNLNATVDISVPEGTHGLTPNLDLVYNSAAGTGLLGLGWELSGLHSVSRDPSYPISYSDSDRFSSSVSGGLIQNGGTQEYGTNPETLMKYKFNGESWTAKDRSGTVYQFGSDDSRNSRVKSPERGTDRNAVRKWGLDSVKDLNGNSYTVDYDGSQELLPVKIEYGSGNRTVEFGYDSALKNKGAREGYVYSSKVLEESILKSITMKAGGTKVREYVFSYDVSSADGIPRLNKIDRTDYINGQAEFYSIALGYTADQAVSISQTPKSLDLDETFVLSRTPMSDKMTCVQDERDCYEAANTNCVSGATYISCRTRHNEVIRACNEYTRLWKNPCFLGVTLPNNTMTVGDVNADGKPEIFRLIGSEDAKNIRIAKTSVNADGSLSDDKNSSPVLQNVNYRTFSTMGWGDADGDGKTDFAYSDGANLLVMYSNGSGFDPPVRMANVSAVIPAFNYFTDMPDRKWKGGLIDINGDGKADYVTVENDKLLSVYLSGGKSFQNRISLSLDDPIYKGAGEDEQTGMFLDMDGDRIPEIVFWETNGYSVMKLSSDFTRAYRTPTLVFPSGENTGDRLNRWQVDMNSDGKQDIVILRDLGSGRLSMDIYYYRGYTPGQVSFEKAVFAVPSEMRFLKKEDLQNNSVLPNKTFADINGDRFPDLVLSDGNITKVYYSSKNSFTDSGISLPSGSLWLAMDVNGDGRAEIFTHKADNDNLLRVTPVTDIFIKIQSHNESRKEARALRRGAELGSAAGAAAGTAAFGFAGGSAVGAYYGAQLGAGIVKYQASMNVNRISTSSLWGWLSFIAQLFYSQKSTIAYYPSPYASRQGLLSTVSDSSPFFEKTVSVTYDYIRNFSSAVKIGTGSYPNLSFPSNETLVKTVSVSDGGGRTDTDTYDYEDTRYIAGDRDSFAQLGFRKITVTHQPENTKEETLIYQTGKLLAGKTESVRAWNSAGSLSSESFHSYTAVSPFGRNLVLPQTQTAKKYRLGNLLLTSSETVSYDLYGNPVSRSVSAGSQNSEEQNEYLNSADFDSYYLGRVSKARKLNQGTQVDSVSYEYDSRGNPERVVKFPGSEAENASVYSYDSYGNTASFTNALGRVTYYSYDSDIHSYPVSVKNPLGHTELKTYNTVSGAELVSTDANGASVEKTYDEFGRLETVKFPELSEETERYVYQLTDSPKGAKTVKFVNDPDNGVSVSTEYFDVEGRTVRKESPLMGGLVQAETMEYDLLGRLVRKSSPYVEGKTNPKYSLYEYDADSVLQKETHPDGSYTVTQESGFNVSAVTASASGAVMSEEILEKNETGQVLKRTVQGKTLSYKYDPAGRFSEISDPENGKTSILYDTAGRKKLQTDENSGTVSYTYDSIGSLKTQKDARGVILTYQYDALNRVERIDSSKGEPPVLFSYDSGSNALGRMSRVQDETGEAHFEYDLRGNMISALKKTDELNVVFRKFYDVLGRLKTSVYPDGTKTHSRYSQSGHLYEITMDSADGQSTGHSLIRYGIEVPDGESLELVRTAGNGTETRIRFDELKKRPLSLAARLNGGHLEQMLSYSYDEKGNITAVEDKIIEGRTQRFEYDSLNRITKASGRYGTEEYRYSEGGNLLQRGAFALKYNDSMHRHAVTEASGPNTGSFQYVYDSAGNMISRNGDVVLYNSRGKMKEMTANGSDKTVYWYDYSGERIKKEIFRQGQSAQTVYSFGGLYDIVREPGQPDRHTLYFKGLQGDLVAQMTREDAVLVGIGDQGLGISRISYIANRIQYSLKSFAVMMFHPKNREVRDALLWFGVMGIVVFILGIGNGQWGMGENGHRVAASKYAYRDVRFSTGILLVSILFEFTACVGKKGGKDGTPPWVLIQSGVSGDTVSISDPGSVPGQGSGLGGQGSVNGMFFLHQDHLGSITMVTDGAGNVVSGGSLGGKANYHYRPYGEIDRMNSSGPDLTKFKYTGQVEDKESGLYYYKARYYDPVIGRFLSADSMSFSKHLMGMNPYMYVFGNPMNLFDQDGNAPSSIVSPEQEIQKDFSALIAVYFIKNSLFPKKMGTISAPGYNYAGDGSTDSNGNLFHIKNRNKTVIELWAISSLFRTFNESKPQGIITNPVNVLVFTVFLAKYLRPTPKTYMDDVSQKHDDEAPNPLGEMYGKKDSEQQTNASFNFVTRADAGLYSGKIRTAEDLGVHLVGRTAYYYYGQLRLGMWAVQSMYDELKVGCSKLLGGHRCGKVR